MLDLKRWGIAKAVMTAHGKNFQDKHNLYPIPQGEIDASAGTLTQNPGINFARNSKQLTIWHSVLQSCGL